MGRPRGLPIACRLVRPCAGLRTINDLKLVWELWGLWAGQSRLATMELAGQRAATADGRFS